jgi:hypothetical protein
MATDDDDKILNLDLNLAVCLSAVEAFIESLNKLYVAVWLLTSGDDERTDKFYRENYRRLLRQIADEAGSLEITDEFRTQYEAQDHAD